jgi:hypothetical protein
LRELLLKFQLRQKKDKFESFFGFQAFWNDLFKFEIKMSLFRKQLNFKRIN